MVLPVKLSTGSFEKRRRIARAIARGRLSLRAARKLFGIGALLRAS